MPIADVGKGAYNAARSAVNTAWDKTAGARTAVGLAGDGNGGALSEAPAGAADWTAKGVAKRAKDFVKSNAGNGSTLALMNLNEPLPE